MKVIILIIAGCYLLKRSGVLTDFLKRLELETTRAAPAGVPEKVEPAHPPETIPATQEPHTLERYQLEAAALATMQRQKIKSAPALVGLYSDSELYQIIKANKWILND